MDAQGKSRCYGLAALIALGLAVVLATMTFVAGSMLSADNPVHTALVVLATAFGIMAFVFGVVAWAYTVSDAPFENAGKVLREHQGQYRLGLGDAVRARKKANKNAQQTPLVCKTCETGTIVRRTRYRLSGPVVAIGYILLIPSMLGIMFAAWAFISEISTSPSINEAYQKEAEAYRTEAEEFRKEARATLQMAGAPDRVIRKVMEQKELSEEVLLDISEQQFNAVYDAKELVIKASGAAERADILSKGPTPNYFVVLSSVCTAVLFLVSGLLGWLLVMRKTVLQCTHCGAVVSAS